MRSEVKSLPHARRIVVNMIQDVYILVLSAGVIGKSVMEVEVKVTGVVVTVDREVALGTVAEHIMIGAVMKVVDGRIVPWIKLLQLKAIADSKGLADALVIDIAKASDSL